MPMKYDDIVVIVPAYNAESTIRELINEIIRNGFDREDIVIINDGSRDHTAQIAREQKVILCAHEKNLGKGMALRSGIDRARSMNKKKVITMDADGQHDPEEIKVFMAHKNDYDLIIGQRIDRMNMPVLRRLVNRTTSLVVSLLCGHFIPDVQCGFRMIDLQIFNRIKLVTANYQTESELVIKAVRQGFRVGTVSVATRYNNEKSYIRPFVDTVRFVKMAVRSLWV
ncbi:hypothetical protein A2Y85_04630 [candidate division WOR-3 bacterium RBG_13_43_14]|uniref:Glycosyltransferase 2-like domain-containing protein n=1 Tax=candidate division WOR-3 bacterium RBG_13_43_14 TaxID=1802590 RepID=A0A1F4U9V9_UNCW3|nr:MAG: hypothetical protein A2Y85_04630 [candidate division WOR-3 bacterium RBG_13_43_14]